MQENSSSVTKCKIVFLGDQSVGKTSIINRFIFDNFAGTEQPTVGVDFVSKTLTVQNKTLRLQLWDTAGQERFHSLIPSYIKDSQASIIVFDITNEHSYENITKWIENVKDVRGSQSQIFILGNKSDLQQQRRVNTTEANKRIIELGFEYSEVSAKNGTNIKQFFRNVAYSISGVSKRGDQKNGNMTDSKLNNPVINPRVNLSSSKIEDPKNNKKKCC